MKVGEQRKTSQKNRGASFVMTTISFVLVIAILAFCFKASAQSCYSVPDHDQRYYCLALTKQDASKCRSIKNRDTRYFCLAEVTKDRSKCRSIKDKTQRAVCLAQVK